MWNLIHFLAGLFGLAVLLGTIAAYRLGYISGRTDGIITMVIFTLAYLDDTHHHEPLFYRVLDLVFVAWAIFDIKNNRPRRPRKKVLRKLGAKGKAALAKLKASMPKVSVPHLVPSPA